VLNLLRQGRVYLNDRSILGGFMIMPFLEGEDITLCTSIDANRMDIHYYRQEQHPSNRMGGAPDSSIVHYDGSHPEVADCVDLMHSLQDVLKFDKIQTNTQFIRTAAGVYVLDINPRVSFARITEFIRDRMGMNFTENSLNWFLGLPNDFSQWNGLYCYQGRVPDNTAEVDNGDIVVMKDDVAFGEVMALSFADSPEKARAGFDAYLKSITTDAPQAFNLIGPG